MPEATLSLKPQSPDIVKSGKVVGSTDRIYEISNNEVVFDEVVIKGDITGDWEYNGHRLRVVRVDSVVGLIVDERGARGPLWKGVVCEVIH